MNALRLCPDHAGCIETTTGEVVAHERLSVTLLIGALGVSEDKLGAIQALVEELTDQIRTTEAVLVTERERLSTGLHAVRRDIDLAVAKTRASTERQLARANPSKAVEESIDTAKAKLRELAETRDELDRQIRDLSRTAELISSSPAKES